MNDVGRFETRMVGVEHEQSVLGALLRLNRAIDQIGDLKEAHFFDSMHRAIFRATLQLILANKPADVLTVFDQMRKNGDNVDIVYLNALQQNTPSAANIRHYVEIVRDMALKRSLAELGHDLIEAVQHSGETGAVMADTMAAKLEALARVESTDEPELAAASMAPHIALIDEQYNGAPLPAIATGLTDIDKVLNGGPRRGNLVVLAARPKMGKTAFALNIANHVATTGVAAVLSLEMAKPELHNRNLASIGLIPLDNLIDPKRLTTEDWPRMTSAIEKIGAMRLYLDAQAGLTLMQVAAKARQIKRKAGGLDMLVIDYLQLMNAPGDNRNAQIESITRGLKSLAKDLDCVVVLLSQLNRKLEDRPNRRPMPSDLRDSGSIEQDCDIAIFLYRDEVYNPDTTNALGVCEANIALNRQGASKVVNLVYRGEFVRFENISPSWHPAPPKTLPAPRRGFDD